MNKTRVLFLCTGNSARSQMAEAFLRRYAGEHFEVYSAGLEPKEINPYTRKVMAELGDDLKGHYAKDVAQFVGKVHFGYVITVCDNADKNCPIFPGIAQRMHWSFEDPAHFVGSDEEKTAKFREVRDQIRNRILGWLKEQNIRVEV